MVVVIAHHPAVHYNILLFLIYLAENRPQFIQFPNWGVPLGPPLQPTLCIWGWFAESGIRDKNPEETPKKFWSVTSPRQDVLHPSLFGATSQPDLESGCFSP